jgi:phosphomannomutase
MTLITTISGIRGTIGGKPGEGLTPPDVVKFAASYATFLKEGKPGKRLHVVIGRDARISGPIVSGLVTDTLLAMGIDVTDLGLTTTPTAEIGVTQLGADGGIIVTASHNPRQWNALKLLNEKGEFLSEKQGTEILAIASEGNFSFSAVDALGTLRKDDSMIDRHIRMILDIPLVDAEAIRAAGFRVAIDCVNSTGALALPPLLEALGVAQIIRLYCEPNGHFPHNPEPLPEHLSEISKVVKKQADLGFVVDPDVDRLAIVCEDGSHFGEEYTLVAVAEYILEHNPGNTVSNLSSSQALGDITRKHGGNYYPSAVGEVNVVEAMKEYKAVIGGEGNGGVIYPGLHYGRDALVGIALFLSHLARKNISCSALKSTYPSYVISKNKITLDQGIDIEKILNMIGEKYTRYYINSTDGLRITFGKEWVHLRKSNTEPVIRIYAESDSQVKAEVLATKFVDDIREILKES